MKGREEGQEQTIADEDTKVTKTKKNTEKSTRKTKSKKEEKPKAISHCCDQSALVFFPIQNMSR